MNIVTQLLFTNAFAYARVNDGPTNKAGTAPEHPR